METTIATVTHLSKSFKGKVVLKDVSLSLKKGENLAVLGQSGCGKSVLIKCLIGLLEADSGSAVLFGEDISSLSSQALNEMRRKVGFLFQNAALYDSMTVRENLEFPLRGSKSLSAEELEKKVRKALDDVGLEEAIDKMPSELSGGMRKRVALARTLILHPAIILYDEPTTGLDPITSGEISRLILEVQKKYEASAIIITHDMECARLTANRMIILRNGIAFAEGTYAELEASQDPWVRAFFK